MSTQPPGDEPSDREPPRPEPPGEGSPDQDPFRKRPPSEAGGEPPSGGGAEPPSPPPPPGSGAGGPRGAGPSWPGGAGPGEQGPYGGGPYGGGPFGGGPYGAPPPGGPYGADPLAGMPPLGSLPRRLCARIIDALLVGIPLLLVVAFVRGGYDPYDPTDSTTMAVAGSVVYFVYEGLMLSHSGQTVGKKLMRIRVAMLSDGAIPRGQAGWLRAAVYSLPELVPYCGFVFWLVNVLWCTWDRPYRQCLHDKAATTVVVSTVPAPAPAP
ncbi:RDD family protein [Streptomyces sp. LX-29]|uniref:RDD family protein n=1 Tax=Streptomyces sp. LX-29 TaxID=2900152 RepID=UPI00240D0A16|nr:RDD family protein [Streptomyces sp. LX-29]WFB09252.1 RDD family protein [Streptomyces sp. LX-29]